MTRLGETTIAMPRRSGMAGDFSTADLRYKAYLTDPGNRWFIKPGQLSEVELERMLVAARRWSDETGMPLTFHPTKVIYGSMS